MVAALATLAFLATFWLANVILADMLERGLGKMVAALKGQSSLAVAPSLPPVAARISQRSRPERALRAQPRLATNLRAAA